MNREGAKNAKKLERPLRLRGEKRRTGHDRRTKYDVFLSHNSADKPAVETLARRLVEASLTPWPDTRNLVSCVLVMDRQISALCGNRRFRWGSGNPL